MKKIYSFSLILLTLAAFSSCKKEYNCVCNINTLVNGKVVANTTSRNTIRAVAEGDAKNQCVYFETEEDYATQQAVVQHFCEIR